MPRNGSAPARDGEPVRGEGDPHLAESLWWAREWPLHKRLHLVHHAGVGQALLRAVQANGVDGQIFNVADDAPVTALELLNLNREPIPEEAASRALDDPWAGIADTAKIRRELGFRPIYPTVYTAKEAGACDGRKRRPHALSWQVMVRGSLPGRVPG